MEFAQQAEAFFDRFTVAFATFNAARVSELFASPGVALRGDGSIVALTGRDDVIRYYQSALDGYRERGCTSCKWTALEVVAMGSRSFLATVTWHLLKQDGTPLSSWRQSYSLRCDGDGPRVFASASHA